MISKTLSFIQKEYLRDDKPWVLAYSGGKDSTAVLKLVFNSLLSLHNPTKQITIIYCDTGVEIPIVNSFVHCQLEKLNSEIFRYKLPVNIEIAKPEIKNRFFSKVIGRGYPTPTNKFRWCTDRLRIEPIQKIMNRKAYTVLVGVRKGESQERDKIINRNGTENPFYLTQSNYSNTNIFAPIINYSTKDVWEAIDTLEVPVSINGNKLRQLYQKASDNNVSQSVEDIHSSRFGCWTCTVIRKDKAVNNLINSGEKNLQSLLDFRNWLTEIRDNNDYRCKYRRNGQKGLGPFTINARKEILNKLLKVQESSNLVLIDIEEIKYIKDLWKIDYNNSNYLE